MADFRAYAKINLGLRVLRKRPDGYHEIETIFHRIDLYDVIRFDQSEMVEVTSSSPDAPGGESNLCHRAVRLLQKRFGHSGGIHVNLQKNIPVGAGLGGGSSDAAVVLRQVPRLWGIPHSDKDLEDLGAQIGSDVSYFLKPGTAYGTGRGEKLEYISFNLPFTVIVCYPGFQISTAWAYSQMKPSHEKPGKLKQRLAVGGQLQDPCRLLKNDFEGPVFSEYPRLGEIKNSMIEHGSVCASLSGTGSSVYGLFRKTEQAESASRYLRSKGYETFTTPPGFSTGQTA